jgi:hypothetical protein
MGASGVPSLEGLKMLHRLPAVTALAAALLGAAPLWAQQYTHGDPTAEEQLVLEIIQRARANPTAEGTRLQPKGLPGGDIKEGLSAGDAAVVGPRPPLAFNANLIASARAHNADLYASGKFQHDSSDGTPWDVRIASFGYTGGQVGENIAGHSTYQYASSDLEDLLMIDSGVAGRGHRKNLLDIYPGLPVFREIGAGYATYVTASPTTGLRSYLTQDFGRSTAGPFLAGVVFNDANGNNFYDIGEGMQGVTINVSPGSWYAVTSTSGGYAVPVGTSGTITVTASGGGLAGTVTTAVTLTGENAKVDIFANDPDGDGMPTSWENANGLNPTVNDAAGDPDGDGLTNLQEFQNTTNPQASDTDGDGMPDGWEVQYGLSPTSSNATGDADADGLSNLAEYQNGANPKVKDTDGDGMRDGWEVQNGFNPADSSDAAADADSDGLSNLLEYQKRTDPNNPDSDGDGMNDGFEVANNFNPLNSDQDANGKIDGQDDWDKDTIINLLDASPGTAPPPPEKKDDKKCGATGLEFLLLLLLRRRRR